MEEKTDFNSKRVKTQKLHRKIYKEYKNATNKEIWEGLRDNFTFGFIGATLVVFIATKTDMAVLLGYIAYYLFMGKIVNRPKYVTDLGKLIVFPIPSALGAFAGYKLSYILINLINLYL
jgi:predicted glycosyltransferase